MKIKIINNIYGTIKTYFGVKSVITKGNEFQFIFGNNRLSKVFRAPEYSYEAEYKGGVKDERKRPSNT